MYVVATAGHVDHGKSTLVRALTGMEPDRWAEEQRRGMTIDLGFAWTTLPSGRDVSFVDVPGHERFITNMLAGVGPAPAVVVVVAADEGWMPQTEEHVRAVEALGVDTGLLVVTKADLADPGPVLADATGRLGFLASLESTAVSARTGAGLDTVLPALDRILASRPGPDPAAPVRLWVDRAFTVRGAGTVVTATLATGRLRVGDRLELAPGGRAVTVRGLQTHHARVEAAVGVSRVGVNLRGLDVADVGRGMALVTPGRWTLVDTVDVVVATVADVAMAREVVVHLGAAAVPARVRALGPGTDAGRLAARVRLTAPLPMHVGDRLLLREPGSRRLLRADVADLSPRPLRRRGDAAAVATTLRLPPSADDVVRAHGVVAGAALVAAGLTAPPEDARRVAGWWIDEAVWAGWLRRLPDLVAGAGALSGGVPLDAVRRELGLPDVAVVGALAAACDGVTVEDGRVRSATAVAADSPELTELLERLSADPLAAPDGDGVRRIGRDVLAFGTRTGRLLDLGGGVYVAPEAPERALERLRALPQPFTVSAAREALGSSRRVVVPLLEHLDAARRTRRLADGRRALTALPG